MLILASASPRRRELLTQGGFFFEVHPAHIPEDPRSNEDPFAYVTRLAREKAQAVYNEIMGAPGPDFGTWETTKPEPTLHSLKGTGFSPYIQPAKETRALAPEGKSALRGLDSHDTVGAVALDAHGNLAAATSTGGTLNKTPGRVGDSSLIGCGCYADNLSAAVSLTGWGEPIMKLVLGKWATDRVASGTAPELAAREAISYLFNRLGGHGGIILLGPDGRFGFAHNTPAMAWGLATPSSLQTGLTF